MTNHTEYIIVGAGPSGLQLGYFFQKHNYNYRIIEKTHHCGSFFDTFPRHKTLISINKVYTGSEDPEFNLRHDWNSLLVESGDEPLLFKTYTEEYFPKTEDYVKYLNDFQKKYKINVEFNTCIDSISKNENVFNLTTNSGESMSCTNLIMATGVKPKETTLNVNFEKIKLLYPNCKIINYSDMCLDKELYKNKVVLIQGNGNSAFETANYLMDVCSVIYLDIGHHAKFAWNSHYPGNTRLKNSNIIDSYLLKSQNVILKEHNCFDIKSHYNFVYPLDFLINCSGFKMDTGVFDAKTINIKLIKEKIPIINYKFESISCKNLYFVGTLTQFIGYKQTSSAFIHGFRYFARALFNIFQYQTKKIKWNSEIISKENIVSYIINRLNSVSSTFQCFGGYMKDFFYLDKNGSFNYVKDIPVRYLDFMAKELDILNIIEISFEYGKQPFSDNPFDLNVKRPPDPPEESNFLHPIFKLKKIAPDYNSYEYSSTFHILENQNNTFGVPDNTDHEKIVIKPLIKLIEFITKKHNNETKELDTIQE